MNYLTMQAKRLGELVDKRNMHLRYSQGCKRAAEHRQLAAQYQKEAERIADMLTQAPRRQGRLDGLYQ
jgi:hypothetical protein